MRDHIACMAPHITGLLLSLLAALPVANAGETCGESQSGGQSHPGTLQGQVFNEQHQPVRAATVSIQKVEFGTGYRPRLTIRDTVLTDATGEYRATNLPPGRYYLSAVLKTAGSFTNSKVKSDRGGFGPTFYPGTTKVSDAQPIALEAGDHIAGLDIVLERKRLARVSGVMVSSRKKLHQGAHVALIPTANIDMPGPDDFSGVSEVAPDGRFVFNGVPPGEYVLKGVSIPLRDLEEIAMTGRSAPLTRSESGEFGTVVMNVDGTDITDVQLMLSRAGRIHGRVVIDGALAGHSTEAMTVRAEPADIASMIAGSNESGIGPDGSFEISGVAGRFVVRLSWQVRGMALERVERHGQDMTDIGLVIDPGEKVDDLRVIITSRPTEVSGRVIASGATQQNACRVIVFSQHAERWSWAATRYVGTSRLERGGAYRVQGLPAGRYFIVAVPEIEEGQWLDPSYLTSVTRQAKRLELREGERKVVDVSF
jgi:hypothetical protein